MPRQNQIRSQPSRSSSAIPHVASTKALGHVERANEYARDVVAGRIEACKWVRAACLRHLNDLKASRKLAYPYVFDENKARKVCMFAELLPHTKGKWAITRPGQSNKLRLEPWQCFILCCLFGWLNRQTRLRRFREAYICVPRKNGKSNLASAVGNYMFCADDEYGAEVYSGATTEAQAWEVFRPARLQFDRTPKLCEMFGVTVNAKSLVRQENGSRFLPVIGKPGDGASPSCAIIDEYHEHADDSLYDTMRTGMLAREQPLLFVITTAGSNLAGPCRALQTTVEQVLDGTAKDDALFGIIYTVDEGDDWTSETALRKANPNYGVSIIPATLRDDHSKAVQSARKQNVFKTKHENIWQNQATVWLNMQKWNVLADAKLREQDFAGECKIVTVDLSNKIDLACTCRVYERVIAEQKHYYAFWTFYLPEERALAPESQTYQGWVHDELLIATDGSMTDYDRIEEDLIEAINKFRIPEFGFDPWNAAQLSQHIAAETFIPVIEIPQQVRTLSEPMKSLEALVLDGRIHHDGDPIAAWCLSNVQARLDEKGNIYPRKDKNQPQLKIDGAVALIMALSRALVTDGSSAQENDFFVL